jgi:hypothetical protein
MNYNQFSNLSCYEEFEILCTLTGVSKIEVLDHIGFNVKGQYWFFVSNDGIFNWFDLVGNHIEDPGILSSINKTYIPKTCTKVVIPTSVLDIDIYTFACCRSLKTIIMPPNLMTIGFGAFMECESLEEIVFKTQISYEKLHWLRDMACGIPEKCKFKCI